MNRKDVINFIDSATDQDLEKIDTAVKQRRGVLQERELTQFSVGEYVEFKHQGRRIIGIIQRLNRKTATIAEKDHPGRRWRVSPNFLRKYEEEVFG